MFSNSKFALVEHLPSSANHTALDQRTNEKPGWRRLNPNLPRNGEVWQEGLVAGPSSALDLALVLCPAGIPFQFDGVQGSVNSPAFFHLSK